MNKFLLIAFLFLLSPFFANAAEIKDFLADEIKDAKIPETNLNYNYQDFIRIPVYLEITEKISTKDKDLYEGKKLLFKVSETSFYKYKTIVKKGDMVEGRVKSITKSGMNGIPYDIVLGDFIIPNIPQNKLKDEFFKEGFNRTYFVLPLKWALTPLPPTGSLTNFIFGGHAKITPKDKITLYYYPNWQ